MQPAKSPTKQQLLKKRDHCAAVAACACVDDAAMLHSRAGRWASTPRAGRPAGTPRATSSPSPVLLARGAVVATVTYCIAASFALFVPDLHSFRFILVACTVLSAVLGTQCPSAPLSVLGYFVLPAPVYEAVRTNGVLSGACRWA